MPMNRRGMLGAAPLLAMRPRPSRAQSPLDGTATIIVPYAPGVTDQEVRALAPLLRPRLGQAVIVDNRGGAGGAIGGRAVATARPDGRTLLYAASAVVSVLPLLPNAAYAFEDLVPLARVTDNPHILAIRADLPYRSIGELVEFARSNPERIVFASSGAGTAVHLAGEAMARASGVQFLHAPFQGLNPAMTAVLGGHADFVIGLPVAIMPAVQDGRLRALAQFGETRNPLAADVPTLTESGIPLVQSVSIGLFAPRGLPDAVAQAWTMAIREAVASTEFLEFARRVQVSPAFLPEEEFGAILQRDRALYREIIPQLGLT